MFACHTFFMSILHIFFYYESLKKCIFVWEQQVNLMQNYKQQVVCTLIIICISLSSTWVSGQTDTSKFKYLDLSLEEILNLEVTTALKSPEKLSDVPATIHLITRNQIETRGYSNLEEVLEDIPELEIQKRASAEYGNYFTLRGVYGTEKFIIMMDGVRINSPTGTPLPIANNYPVANAQQIEIILGPASALYGVDAFTGIINIITFNGSDIKNINVQASYGSFNSLKNNILVGGKYEDLSFSIMGNIYKSDEPDFPSLHPNDFYWYNNEYRLNGNMLLPDNSVINTEIKPYSTPTFAYALHAKLNYKDFEAGYFRNYESHGSSFSVKPEYSIYSDDAIFGEWVESMYVRHKQKINNNKWNFLTSLSYSKDEIDPKSNYQNSFTSYEQGYKYAFNKAVKLEEQISWFPNENSSFIIGFTMQDIASLPKSGDLPHSFDRSLPANHQNMYYIGTNVTDSLGNNLSILQDFYYLNYQNYGVYLQSHFNIKNSLLVTLGARYDYNTRYTYSINPRIGLVYTPIEKLKIKLLYGEAFFAPSPYSVYQHYGSFVTTVDSVSGNVTGFTSGFWRLPPLNKLESQKIKTYEAGISYFLNKSLFVTVNSFYNNLTNLLGTEGFTGEYFHNIPVGYLQRPVNKGTASTYGGTVKLNYKTDFSSFLLSSYVAYSYIDGEIEGKQLPFAAKHSVKAGVSATIRKLTLSTRFQYRSESYHRSIKKANGELHASDPYLIANMHANYKIIKREKLDFSIFTTIKNVFNTDYYNLPIGGSECFPSVPQDPIRIDLGVKVSL